VVSLSLFVSGEVWLPGNGIGRFGNAPVGGVVGPGTDDFSLSLMKNITLYEKSKFQFGLEAANVFNHRNYEPPTCRSTRRGSARSLLCKSQKAQGRAAWSCRDASPSKVSMPFLN
jgi:hypothetical protein